MAQIEFDLEARKFLGGTKNVKLSQRSFRWTFENHGTTLSRTGWGQRKNAACWKNANKKISPTKKTPNREKNLSTQSKVENNYRLVLLRFESPTPRMKKCTKLIFLREPVTQNQPKSESLNLIFLFESQLNVFCFEFVHNILIQKL